MARSRRARSSLSLAGRPSAAEKKPALARLVAPAMTFSRTVMPANSPTPCRVRAMPSPASLCGLSPSSRSPRQRSTPSSGSMKPQTTLNSVVLPAPFGPMTPSTSPGSTNSDTESSAVRPPKRTVTPSTSKRPGPRPVPSTAVPPVRVDVARDVPSGSP